MKSPPLLGTRKNNSKLHAGVGPLMRPAVVKEMPKKDLITMGKDLRKDVIRGGNQDKAGFFIGKDEYLGAGGFSLHAIRSKKGPKQQRGFAGVSAQAHAA